MFLSLKIRVNAIHAVRTLTNIGVYLTSIRLSILLPLKISGGIWTSLWGW